MNYHSLITCLVVGMSVGTLFGDMRGGYSRVVLPEVDTAHNTEGIEEGDVCRYNPRDKTVVCQSGKSFKNVGKAESALTGTPGHISYRNYIGRITTQASTEGKEGSGKRLDICADGACLRN